MGQIGSYGDLFTFETSSDRVFSPQDMKRTQSSRWHYHGINNRAPRAEFAGPDGAETTMTLILSCEHGVKPRQTIFQIEKAIREGTVDYLVIGGSVFGWGGKWSITKCSEAWDRVLSEGELAHAKVDVTFKEYQ